MGIFSDWQIVRLAERLKESKRFTFHIFATVWNEELKENLVYELRPTGAMVRMLQPDQREALIESWLWANVLGFASDNKTSKMVVLVVSETLPPDIMQSEINLINGDLMTSNCGKEVIK